MTTPNELPETDVHDAAARARSGTMLIDVREQHEWDLGHAPEAVHVPLGNLAAAVLPPGPVLVTCRSGSRSSDATRLLIDRGVDAINVCGGMAAWADADLAMVTSGDHSSDQPTVA